MTKEARSTAPVKTGNLKYNGIYSIKTVNGFKIVWDRQYAHYINIQDQKYHKDFVRLGMLKATMQLRETTLKRTLKSKKEANLRNTLPYFMSQNYNGTTLEFGKRTSKMLRELTKSVRYMQNNEPDYANKTNVVNYFENGQLVEIQEYDNELIN